MKKYLLLLLVFSLVFSMVSPAAAQVSIETSGEQQESAWPPNAPARLTASAISSDMIKLAWVDKSSVETGFVIERKTGNSEFAAIAFVKEDTVQFVDKELKPATTYTYRVMAYNSYGKSRYSNEASATTHDPAPGFPPEAPANLSAISPSSSSVKLAWVDKSVNESGFIVERRVSETAFQEIARLSANTTGYTDTGLTSETTYTYRVKAYNGFGISDPSNTAVVKTGASSGSVLPGAPENLTAEAVNSKAIMLKWIYQDDTEISLTENNITGFKIERMDPNGSFIQIACVLPGEREYFDTGLQENTEHTYRIRAYNAYGDSGYSNEASATTPPGSAGLPPAGPSGLQAAAVSSTQINLAWVDNAENEEGFVIERMTSSGNFTEIARTGENTVSYADTGLSPETAYSYRVYAYNANSISEYSNIASATTPEEGGGSFYITQLYKIGVTDYYVNGVKKTMDVAPVIIEDRTFLPVRYVTEALGAEVGWNETDRKVTITMGEGVVELWIGENMGRVNGEYVIIDPSNPAVVPFILEPGRTMIPLRFVSENLWCNVVWYGQQQEVVITYPL